MRTAATESAAERVHDAARELNAAIESAVSWGGFRVDVKLVRHGYDIKTGLETMQVHVRVWDEVKRGDLYGESREDD